MMTWTQLLAALLALQCTEYLIARLADWLAANGM